MRKRAGPGWRRARGSGHRRAGAIDRKEMRFAWHALQRVKPPVVELQSRAGHEILDRVRDQNLAALADAGDARADVHRDAGELGAAHFALAGVQPRAHLEPQPLDTLGDGTRGSHAARGAVERSQEPVAGGVDLPATEVYEALADERMVGVEQIPPAPVA